MRIEQVVFVLVMTLACGSKPVSKKAGPAPSAQATVFLYNSTGTDVGVQVRFGGEKETLDLDLANGASRALRMDRAISLKVKVIRPAGLGALDQTLDVPPTGQNRGDFLLDLGGRGSFHQWPFFYAPAFQASKWKVPEEVKDRFPVKEIPGPKFRYDLDFRAAGMNRGLRTYLQSSEEPGKGHVYLVIVDDACRRRLEQGGQLSVQED